MEHRLLGRSGFSVPVLMFGTAGFGGSSTFSQAWGATQLKEAVRLIDICLDAGITMLDTADVYGDGDSEVILGKAIQGRRDNVLISTKATLRSGSGPNDIGSSRIHLIESVHRSLRRLKTDYIDLFQVHTFDACTPVEETLGVLNDLVRAGKIRYIGCSNFAGWQLMKSLAVSQQYGWTRYIAHQAYYSLIGRDYEWELMPLAADQGIGTIVWSPLGWGRLTGKIRRNQPLPDVSRLHVTAEAGPPVSNEFLYTVVDVIEDIAVETGKTVPQIAINWLLQRPTVSSVIIGARNVEQLKQNIGAIGWTLTREHMNRLDEATTVQLPYPYWHQRGFAERNPYPTD